MMAMSSEQRRLQHFGMSTSDNRASLYAGSIAAGALCCTVVYVLAVRAGQLTFVSVPPLRWISGAITACLAFAFAPLQEIVFRGYLL